MTSIPNYAVSTDSPSRCIGILCEGHKYLGGTCILGWGVDLYVRSDIIIIFKGNTLGLRCRGQDKRALFVVMWILWVQPWPVNRRTCVFGLISWLHLMLSLCYLFKQCILFNFGLGAVTWHALLTRSYMDIPQRISYYTNHHVETSISYIGLVPKVVAL